MVITKKIFLVRHGPTISTKGGLYCGSESNPCLLKNIGHKISIEIAHSLSSRKIDAIITSPLLRAKQTAKYTAEEKKLSLIQEDRFKEINYGIWEGLSKKDVFDTQVYKDWIKDPSKYKPPRSESAESAICRAKKAIFDYMKIYDSFAVFTHKAIIRLLYGYFNKIPIKKYRDIHGIATGLITLLELDPGDIFNSKLGLVSHIPKKFRDSSLLNY